MRDSGASEGTCRSRLRSFLEGTLGAHVQLPRGQRLLVLALVFLVAFAVRSLYAVDLGGVMYSHQQPGSRMSNWYDGAALSILKGGGILFPTRRPEPSDTALLARPPGYPVLLAVVYRLLGRSSFTVLLVQNLLLSFSPALVFLVGERLLSWRVAAMAGLLTALSPHLAITSNFILADAPSALPILGAMLVLAAAKPQEGAAQRLSLLACGLAGALIGLGTWLRPNLLLLGPFLGVTVLLLFRPRRAAAARGALLALVSWAVVSPITIRNYAVYGEFVPVSINGGLPLWHGVAEAGGQKFGARKTDRAVMAEEVDYYGEARYGEWWATPDGIRRDRERFRRAFAVIREHPLWYGRAMVRRMAQMLDYDADAPFVRSEGARAAAATPPQADDVAPWLRPRFSDASCLAVGRALSWTRNPVRMLQAVVAFPMPLAVFIGIGAVWILSWRTAIFLLAVPSYYVLLQSLFLLEWRVVAPMHHWLFVLAAVSWVVLGAGAWSAGRLLKRLWTGPRPSTT